ncbi:uncharacterized protein LOC106653729 isoform X1 [Trichogramma pretiosum]|uniref:uncharacterized protein LOC106653729 isoform X1 n=1 Tax=Trichogramma pretiosum TaxID=7493 RepID=UPI000C71A97B|nr:uncharacterized protein LOC106653729 isoform X1 [Trichogramma pretiosum]
MNRGLHLMTARTLKRDAGAIIKLREYIIANDIKEENLEDPAVLTAMLRASVRKYANENTPVTPELLNKFKEAIYGTCSIDNFKTVELYFVCNIIAIVACVEYVLYPRADKEEYEKLYRGDKQKAIEAYNKLCRFPADKIPDEDKLNEILFVFKRPEFFKVNSPLEAIRSYLKSNHYFDREMIRAMVTTFSMSKFVYKNLIDSFKDLLPNLPKNDHQLHPTVTVTYYINTHKRLIHSN